MGYAKTEVWYYPASTGAGEDITSKVTSWKTSQNINKKTGTFNVELVNPQGFNTGSLQYGDNIELKVGYLGSAMQSLMFGIIEEEGVGATKGTLSYRGIDYAGKLMDSIVQQVYNSGTEIGDLWRINDNGVGSTLTTYDGGSINSAVVIQHLLRQFYYKSLPNDSLDYVTHIDMGCHGWATVDAFKDVGSDFFKNFNSKRLNECIDEIKGDKFTGNHDYLFYVDNLRMVHFEPKPSETYDTGIDEDNDVNNFDMDRSTMNQYTAILLNAGQVSGTNYDTYCAGYNRTAIRQSGWRWGYIDEKGIASQTDHDYPSDSVNTRLGKVKEMGRGKATIIATDQGLPKWGGKITIKGSNTYTVGSAYDVIFQMKHFGDGEGDLFGSKKLRLIGVDHAYDNKGWRTTLDLKQDYGDIR